MEQKVTQRQFLVMLFCALLSPMVRVVPGVVVRMAGLAGWLAPIAALPVLLLAAWWIGSGLRRTEGSLPALYQAAFGEVGGRVACGLSAAAIWLLFCSAMRFYGERFVSTMYPDTGLGVFFLLLLLALLWMAGRKLAVWARAGQIFFYVALAVLALALVLSVGKVSLYHVWPVWTQDAGPVALAAVPIIGALSGATAVCFSAEEVQLGRSGRTLGWCALFCLVLLVTGFVIVGVFGAGTTAELQVPFFSLAKEANIQGAVERLESVVSCVWVFTDVLFLGLLGKGAVRALCAACRCGEEKRLLTPLLLAAFPAGWLIASDAYTLEEFFRTALVYLEMIVLLALPAAACVVERLRAGKA